MKRSASASVFTKLGRASMKCGFSAPFAKLVTSQASPPISSAIEPSERTVQQTTSLPRGGAGASPCAVGRGTSRPAASAIRAAPAIERKLGMKSFMVRFLSGG